MKNALCRLTLVTLGLFALGLATPVPALAQTDVLVVEGTKVGIIATTTPSDLARLSVFNMSSEPESAVLSIVDAVSGAVLMSKTIRLLPGTGDNLDFVALESTNVLGVIQRDRTRALVTSLQVLGSRRPPVVVGVAEIRRKGRK